LLDIDRIDTREKTAKQELARIVGAREKELKKESVLVEEKEE